MMTVILFAMACQDEVAQLKERVKELERERAALSELVQSCPHCSAKTAGPPLRGKVVGVDGSGECRVDFGSMDGAAAGRRLTITRGSSVGAGKIVSVTERECAVRIEGRHEPKVGDRVMSLPALEARIAQKTPEGNWEMLFLNIGREHGVVEEEFFVLRNDTVVARIRVVAVAKSFSVARIESQQKAPQVGDVVRNWEP